MKSSCSRQSDKYNENIDFGATNSVRTYTNPAGVKHIEDLSDTALYLACIMVYSVLRASAQSKNPANFHFKCFQK